MYSDKTARLEIYYQALPTFVQTHSQMVGQYAEILANYAQLRMSAERTSGELPEQVNWMGRYHDIGKAVFAQSDGDSAYADAYNSGSISSKRQSDSSKSGTRRHGYVGDNRTVLSVPP